MQILVFFLYTHTDLVILFVHERAVTLWYQQGEIFFTLASNQPVFVFWYSGKLRHFYFLVLCTIRGAIPIPYALMGIAKYLNVPPA